MIVNYKKLFIIYGNCIERCILLKFENNKKDFEILLKWCSCLDFY